MSLPDLLQESLQESVIARQSTRPLLLNQVAFTGAEFSDKYYHTLVTPLFNEEHSNVIPLSKLNHELGRIQDTLLYTGLFKNITVKLDLAEELTAPITKGQSNLASSTIPVNAQFKLEQLPLFKFASSSRTSDTTSSVGFHYLDPNLLKQACSLLVDINVNYDPLNNKINSKIWDLTFLKPLEKYPQTRAILNPVISSVDASSWANHEQYSVGALLGLQSTKLHTGCACGPATSIFTTGVSFINRQIRNVSNTASDSIRAGAGNDFKLSANFNYKLDSRKQTGKFSTDGVFVDFTNELAGYNTADVFADSSNHTPLESFNKSILRIQSFKSFFNQALTGEVDFETGLIFQKSNDSIPLIDRFTLGGLNSLRGFHLNSVGPKDGEDFIGGSSIFRTNLSLYSKIPNISVTSPLRLHTFLNIGDVFNFKDVAEFKKYTLNGDLFNKSALATGVGLVYRDENALVDLSYNVPLNVRGDDIAKPGFGFSVALRFA
jgi:outer membrane protein assembly factor BamA